MREIAFFVASLAGAAILTALAVLNPEASLFWKYVLCSGIVILSICALALFADIIRNRWPKKQIKKQLSIPISITPLSAPTLRRYSGLYPNFEGTSVAEGTKDPEKYDPPYTLKMFLIITDKNGRVSSLDNEGFGPFRRRMGRDDWVTRRAILDGAELPKFILSPVHILPQTTVYGSMPFIISVYGFGEPGDASILEYYVNGVVLAAPRTKI